MSFKSKEWMDYLYYFWNKTNGKLNIQKNKPKAAVIIESRTDELLKLVINNFMYFLQDEWSLYILHTDDNENYIKEFAKEMGNIYFINLNVNKFTVEQYNSLLTSESFYNLFHCDNILIFQMDTLLRKKIPDEFTKYDYVGAPWSLDMPGIWRGMVGNGGLSLRKCSSMKKIINYRQYQNVINEDGYFSYFCKVLNMNVPDFNTAASFSVETVFHKDPIGLHQPHVEKFDINEYLKILIP